jgi:hydrogen peroxide-dependent heme synthase
MHNPDVPETLEGWSILHQMFRLNWAALRELEPDDRHALAKDAATHVAASGQWEEGGSALVQLLGHKGDLMFVHFRRSFEELSCAQLALARSELSDYLEPTTSYVSVVELGMYEMTAKIHRDLGARGLTPGSDEYEQAYDGEMKTQRDRVASRLFTEIPQRRHVCFYPMNKRRGEEKNWYRVPFQERAEMMREHGIIGRHYSGKVTHIISGSIGFDDWEWAVDLFADDPLVFKKLIYEMRFDRASAEYAEFGPFYVGLQFDAAELPTLLDGRTPGFSPRG